MTYCKWSRQQAGRCSLATYYELAVFWRSVPPAEIQLLQIASALGIKPREGGSAPASAPRSGSSPAAKQEMSEQGLQELAGAGMPVFQGPLPDYIKQVLEGLPLD